MRVDLRSRGRAEQSTLSVTFGLVGALVAFAVLRVSDAYTLDAVACHVGVLTAAGLGALAAWGVQRLRRHPRWLVPRWALVPLAGGLVGMTVQAVLLRTPATIVGQPVGLTKADPVSWILVGLPAGAIPALLVALLLRVSLHVVTSGRVPALDARERMVVPASGACLVLATVALGMASPRELPAVVLAVVLAFLALAEVVVRDLSRARWLAQVFAGQTSFEVVALDEAPSEDLPPFIGGAPAEVAIVSHGEGGYRTASRKLLAVTANHLSTALAPLVRRRHLAVSFVGVALVSGGLVLGTR